MTGMLMDKSVNLSSCAEKMELVFVCMNNRPIMLDRSFLVHLVAEKIHCGVVGTGPGLLEWVAMAHFRMVLSTSIPNPSCAFPGGRGWDGVSLPPLQLQSG